MKSNAQKLISAQQGASDIKTNVVAAEEGRDTNALTAPALKGLKETKNRISKRLHTVVGVRPFAGILATIAHDMFIDLEPGRNWKSSLKESGWFAPDGSLSQRGMHYLDRNVGLTLHETYRRMVSDDDRNLLAQVFDLECCMYLMTEWAADELAEGKTTTERTDSIE